ncbi:phenylalanine ammonia-lyase [Leptodontidium sp. 2 PMI_412]|nr:phenylalanine ammonia-lyase [Leptodontidium sp. 2 PMI_412]
MLDNVYATAHAQHTVRSWRRVNQLVQSKTFIIDGSSLDIATVVALARFGCTPVLKDVAAAAASLSQSVQTLNGYLSKGYFLYGVNTGFGGSADTRTRDLLGLQRALMQHVQSGVLTSEDISGRSTHEYLESHSMPSAWTRAMILVRINTNLRGHSAMCFNVLEAMMQLLRHDIVPVVPLRGSVSASGDLMPMSYIAAAIQGNPDAYVRVGKPEDGNLKVISAEAALKNASLEPIVLGPKEGLSLINGTSGATAVAVLGQYEANQLAVISQLLTALTSEALYANTEWAHPFIAAVRPHPGQIEAAQNIRTFLRGSKLTYGLEAAKDRLQLGLAQERYATRSSPQWLAPQLEDLLSAEQQLVTELNSTTDNPVANVEGDDIHCGANFQAASVTSATEKTRLALHSIGKMLFAQTSEMINDDLSNGLPPNLAADDPSSSFCLKGVDVNTAAYTSELGFLANPVSNHVQTAEMHNQSINSLGLLSARQTLAAVEVLSLIVANCLYTGCQGVDLRVLHRTFLERIREPSRDFALRCVDNPAHLEHFFDLFWTLIETRWYELATLDAAERCEAVSQCIAIAVVRCPDHTTSLTIPRMAAVSTEYSQFLLRAYTTRRDAFFLSPPTAEYLGRGTKAIYCFVREKLGVPMHQGLVEHPIANHPSGNTLNGRHKKTIGSWVSIIYEALRNGSLCAEVFQFLEQAGMGGERM